MQNKLSIGELQELLQRIKVVSSQVSMLPKLPNNISDVEGFIVSDYYRNTQEILGDLSGAIYYMEKAILEKRGGLN